MIPTGKLAAVRAGFHPPPPAGAAWFEKGRMVTAIWFERGRMITAI